MIDVTTEYQRLEAHYQGQADWLRWGPYLENYSPDGDAWRYFLPDHARACVYRRDEDGLTGISDDKDRLCLALALWNNRNPIPKERMFGLPVRRVITVRMLKSIIFTSSSHQAGWMGWWRC